MCQFTSLLTEHFDYCKLAYQAQLGKESVLLLLCLYFFGGFKTKPQNERGD